MPEVSVGVSSHDLLHVLLDVGIGLSYVAISATLIWFWWRVRDRLPVNGVLVAFAAFIITCGAGHFAHAAETWLGTSPTLEAVRHAIDGITLLASVATAISLPPLIPHVVRLLAEAAVAESRRVELAVAARDLALRDEFLAVAAHEIRTPLTGIRGHVQLLARAQERGRLDPARVASSVAILNTQTDKLARLISQLLDLSRVHLGVDSVDRAPTDAAALVARAVEEARSRAAGHDILLEHIEPATVLADPMRLEQVLVNLLDNAVKYSPTGGAIQVRLETGQRSVRITVRDHGLGVPEDERPHIFERYFRAHRRDHISGLGLGLYLTRQIVEQHQGEIVAEFPEDGGTRFVVRLPLAAPSGAAPDPTPATGGSSALSAVPIGPA